MTMRALVVLAVSSGVAIAEPVTAPDEDVFSLAARTRLSVYWRVPSKPAMCQSWTFEQIDARHGSLRSHDKLLSFRYRLVGSTVVLEGTYPSRGREFAVCKQTLSVLGDDDTKVSFESGAWYWTPDDCMKATATPMPRGCAAVVAHALASRAKMTGRTPFEKRVRGGGTIWTLSGPSGSVTCDAWTIRTQKMSRKDGTWYGIDLEKATLELTGPNAPGPGDAGGSRDLFAVVPVNRTTTLVGGTPWFLTEAACEASRAFVR